MSALTLRIVLASAIVIAAGAGVHAASGSIGLILAVQAGVAAILALAIGLPAGHAASGLVRLSRAITGGDLSRRAVERPAGELGELTEAMNEMAQALEERFAASSQERNRLMAALHSSADAVVAVDATARITFANAAAERLLARERPEVLDQPFGFLLPYDQLVEALQASIERAERRTMVIELPGRQYVHVTTTPIVGGGEWAALAVFHDLTDVRRTEQVRRDFVANVSHELRTPLASVKAVIETLEGGADPETARAFLHRANEEIDRLVALVEELLELSRIESGELPLARQPVELAALARRAAERLAPQAEARRVAVELDLADALPPVLGDAERLERVVMNLLHNALKFTPEGGSVRLRTALEDGAVTLSVTDSGAGLAPEDLPRVFERFYKADRARGSAGAGLGLAIVKHTVEAHGGSARVESEAGRGSTFTVSLPPAQAAG